jgi:hypothetical protein
MMLERALGQGIQSQRDFRTNMLSGLGSDLITAGVMGMDDGDGLTDGVSAKSTPRNTNFVYNPSVTKTPKNFIYTPSGRSDMLLRRDRFRGLGAYK